MRVAFKLENFNGGETSEGDVSLDLVGLSQTEGALWAYLAVVLNCHHCVEQTILFGHAAIDFALVGVLGRGVLQWVSFLLSLLLLGRCLLILVSFIVNFKQNVCVITSERSRVLILVILIDMLCVDVAELAEDEVTGAGKEETFSGELVLLRECNSHRDVVVSLDSAHTPPELKLFKL